ncbi:hypothetical protein KY337_05170 [Candidatus Woesearchaeota archaeon]|nr:hypothetical protein [Candidatus Woesearchaeota archaeon]
MKEDDVEYLIDQDITIAPAEEIPLDGTGIVEDFESYHKKHKKKFKRTKASKKTAKKAEEKLEEKPAEEKKVEKKKPEKKPKKEKVKVEKEEKVETKPEKEIEPEKVEIKEPEPKEEEPQDLPNYNQTPGGIKYFGITVLLIIVIIAAIFAIRYCGDKEEIIQIESPTGQSVNVIASSQYSYNGFDFSQGNDGLWYTYVQIDPQTEYYVRLHYGPIELEKIPIEGDIDESFKNINKVYLTFDPEGESLNHVTLATGEIGTNFVKAFQIGLEGACTVNKTKACEARPIVTCEDAEEPTIYLKEAEETKVIMQGSCITVQGKDEELIMAAERLLYFLYGVMQR